MSIATLYVQGTKKAVNERLARGETVWGEQFSMYGGEYKKLNDMADGTVIKFFTKLAHGSPYAQSYGNWKPAKKKVI